MMRKVTTEEGLLSAPLNAVMPRSSRVQALFWQPQYARNDVILWHIPFLFWVLELSRPRQYVEIGVGEGVAYMAACQCLHRVQPDARCDAVGTWAGEGDVVDAPAKLVSRNTDLYGHFSRILTDGIGRGDRHFAAASIDFLLIDMVATARAGLTAATVIETIQEKWLGKLSNESIILVHGTAQAEGDVAAFIDGMSARMPTIQLPGGEGMTVLLYGKNVIEQLGDLVSLTEDHPEHQARQAFIEMFTRLGAANYYEMSSQSQEERASSAGRHFEELKAEYEKLAEQLKDSRAQYEGRHRQIANLQAKSFDLQIAEEMRRIEADRLKYRLKKARDETGRLQVQLDEGAASILQLQNEYEKAQSEFTELKTVAVRRKGQIDRLSEELTALRTERDDLESHRKAEEAKAREAHQSRQADQSKLLELEKLFAERGGQIAQLKQNLTLLNAERDDLLERQQADAKALQALEAAREADRSASVDLKTAFDDRSADVERLSQESKTLRAERDDLLERQQADAKALEALKAARETDRSASVDLKAAFDGRGADIERLSQESKTLRAERDELLESKQADATALQALEAARETDRSALSDLKAAFDDRIAEVERLSQEAKTLRAERDELLESKQADAEALRVLETARETDRSALADLKAAFDERVADVERLSQESATLQADRAGREMAYAQLEEAQQSAISTVSQLRTLVATHEGELVRLSGELAEAQQRCTILSEQRDVERAAHAQAMEEGQASFQAASMQHADSISGFEADLAKHRDDNARLQAELTKAAEDMQSQELAAREEFSRQLKGTKILLEDLAHSENLLLSLKVEFGELKDQLAAAQQMNAEVQAYQARIAEFDDMLAERDAQEAATREELARHLEGTRALLQAMEQSENVIQALSMELRFVQDKLVAAEEAQAEIDAHRPAATGSDYRELEALELALHDALSTRDSMVATIQGELALQIQETEALREALIQFDTITQALNAEIDYFQQRSTVDLTQEPANSNWESPRYQRASRLTLWNAALAQGAS
ncbi:hypothetical protein ACWGM0_06310 [Sphingomonas bisphenolicum]